MMIRTLALALLLSSPALAQDMAGPPAEGEASAPAEAPALPLQLDIDASKRWGLVIHGGAGVMDRKTLNAERQANLRDGMKAALDVGARILADGGSAVDAVEAVVAVLEDDPNFNAGRGAALTQDGNVALDAAIMDGKTRAAGAVAGTTGIRNPVKAARAALVDGRHPLLAGSGADAFAAEKGLEAADQSWFETPERRRELELVTAKAPASIRIDRSYGGVGAVALDVNGHLAAASSTGGMAGKRAGRVGDTALIGAGTYADNRACAIAGSGDSVAFVRLGLAHEICARARLKGENIVKAAGTVLAEAKALGGEGGVILIAPTGQMGWSFNTPALIRAGRDSTGREKIAIFADE